MLSVRNLQLFCAVLGVFATFCVYVEAQYRIVSEACPKAVGPQYRCVSGESCVFSLRGTDISPPFCGPGGVGKCCPVISNYSPPKCGIRQSQMMQLPQSSSYLYKRNANSLLSEKEIVKPLSNSEVLKLPENIPPSQVKKNEMNPFQRRNKYDETVQSIKIPQNYQTKRFESNRSNFNAPYSQNPPKPKVGYNNLKNSKITRERKGSNDFENKLRNKEPHVYPSGFMYRYSDAIHGLYEPRRPSEYGNKYPYYPIYDPNNPGSNFYFNDAILRKNFDQPVFSGFGYPDRIWQQSGIYRLPDFMTWRQFPVRINNYLNYNPKASYQQPSRRELRHKLRFPYTRNSDVLFNIRKKRNIKNGVDTVEKSDNKDLKASNVRDNGASTKSLLVISRIINDPNFEDTVTYVLKKNGVKNIHENSLVFRDFIKDTFIELKTKGTVLNDDNVLFQTEKTILSRGMRMKGLNRKTDLSPELDKNGKEKQEIDRSTAKKFKDKPISEPYDDTHILKSSGSKWIETENAKMMILQVLDHYLDKYLLKQYLEVVPVRSNIVPNSIKKRPSHKMKRDLKAKTFATTPFAKEHTEVVKNDSVYNLTVKLLEDQKNYDQKDVKDSIFLIRDYMEKLVQKIYTNYMAPTPTSFQVYNNSSGKTIKYTKNSKKLSIAGSMMTEKNWDLITIRNSKTIGKFPFARYLNEDKGSFRKYVYHNNSQLKFSVKPQPNKALLHSLNTTLDNAAVSGSVNSSSSNTSGIQSNIAALKAAINYKPGSRNGTKRLSRSRNKTSSEGSSHELIWQSSWESREESSKESSNKSSAEVYYWDSNGPLREFVQPTLITTGQTKTKNVYSSERMKSSETADLNAAARSTIPAKSRKPSGSVTSTVTLPIQSSLGTKIRMQAFENTGVTDTIESSNKAHINNKKGNGATLTFRSYGIKPSYNSNEEELIYNKSDNETEDSLESQEGDIAARSLDRTRVAFRSYENKSDDVTNYNTTNTTPETANEQNISSETQTGATVASARASKTRLNVETFGTGMQNYESSSSSSSTESKPFSHSQYAEGKTSTEINKEMGDVYKEASNGAEVSSEVTTNPEIETSSKKTNYRSYRIYQKYDAKMKRKRKPRRGVKNAAKKSRKTLKHHRHRKQVTPYTKIEMNQSETPVIHSAKFTPARDEQSGHQAITINDGNWVKEANKSELVLEGNAEQVMSSREVERESNVSQKTGESVSPFRSSEINTNREIKTDSILSNTNMYGYSVKDNEHNSTLESKVDISKQKNNFTIHWRAGITVAGSTRYNSHDEDSLKYANTDVDVIKSGSSVEDIIKSRSNIVGKKNTRSFSRDSTNSQSTIAYSGSSRHTHAMSSKWDKVDVAIYKYGNATKDTMETRSSDGSTSKRSSSTISDNMEFISIVRDPFKAKTNVKITMKTENAVVGALNSGSTPSDAVVTNSENVKSTENANSTSPALHNITSNWYEVPETSGLIFREENEKHTAPRPKKEMTLRVIYRENENPFQSVVMNPSVIYKRNDTYRPDEKIDKNSSQENHSSTKFPQCVLPKTSETVSEVTEIVGVPEEAFKSEIDVQHTIGGRLEDEPWPWLTAIYDYPSLKFVCAGTLVDEIHIISAAHCFVGRGPQTEYAVVIGSLQRLDSKVNAFDLEKLHLVERLFVHEGFKLECYCNDIAVMRLQKPLGPEFTPVCLPRVDTAVPGENSTILGWGDTIFNVHASGKTGTITVQRVDDLILYNPHECRQIMSQISQINLPSNFGEYYICAGVPDGTKDACVGDSGGPLMHEDYDGIWSLLGVVSFGYKCGTPGVPGTYSRISYYMPWIINIIESQRRDLRYRV